MEQPALISDQDVRAGPGRRPGGGLRASSSARARGARSATASRLPQARAGRQERHAGGGRSGRAATRSGPSPSRARSCAPPGRYSVHERWGATLTLRSLRAAARGRVRARRADRRRRRSPYEQMAADLEALIETVQRPHLRELLRRLLDPATRDRSRLPQRARGEVLPPGLSPRAARALPLGRPGRQRDGVHLPRHRPRRGGHRRACCTTSARCEAYASVNGAIELTDAGKLHGEIPLGYYLVRRAIDDVDGFPAADAQALLHIILSHHGKLEHGSPVVPCTREATLVHFIDNLGGNLGSFDRIEKSLAEGASWSAFDRGISGLGLLRAAHRRRARSGLAPGAIAANSGAPTQTGRGPPGFPLILGPDGQGHREAHPAAVADLVPDGGAAARLRARDQAGRRGLLADERRGLRAPLLRRPRRARRRSGSSSRSTSRPRATTRPRTTRCRRRTSTCRRSSSPSGSWARCARRCRCSTASSPTPSRCGWRCSSSRGASRRRSTRRSSARWRWRSRPAPGGRELSQRLSKVETAIFRRKTIVFDYYTIGRDAEESRKVDPYHLLYRGGQFYLIGYSHERDDVRVFRVSRIRGKVGYSSKAEHDFTRPEDFDPRIYADAHRLAARRHGRDARGSGSRTGSTGSRCATSATPARSSETDDGVVFETDYADPRQLVSWVLGLGEQARILDPPELVEEAARAARAGRRAPRAARSSWRPRPAARHAASEEERDGDGTRRVADPAGALRAPGDAGRHPDRGRARAATSSSSRELCETLQVSEQELRQDIDVLNVVNFGGGSYVLYAEVQGDTIEVDPEPYGDNFAQPARLLPLEAKALVAAIDLIGEHLPEGSLASARARRSSTRSARTRPRRACRSRPPRATTPRSRAWSSSAIADAPAARDRVLQGERGRVHRAHGRAVQAAERPGGLVRALLRPRAATARARSGSTASASATVLDEDVRAARGRRARRARLAEHRRGARRRAARACGSRPSARAGRARTGAWSRS